VMAKVRLMQPILASHRRLSSVNQRSFRGRVQHCSDHRLVSRFLWSLLDEGVLLTFFLVQNPVSATSKDILLTSG